ncbi:TraB/GumN family protein [Winogradskyella sp.]|uniref:TraB/GumN family protein n=1 Tax=Winogradskyella sp. TaxID=1883156 RepID=UPI001AFFBAD4|nr:TraB/GumN family protein [Winogradskyella sp.]MBO6880164.1 TraB/GumN family protein [Winogradskyella sp.]
MKRILSAFVATLISIFSINAQELENSTLWKIEGNGLENPSYLFGTIHLTCDATLEDDVKRALDETSQIVLELDMDDPTMQTKLMSGIYLSEGESIKDYVSDNEYKAIDSLLTNQLGMPLKLMENVKPFFLSSSLYPKMLDCSMQSFELEFMKVAKEQNEDIKGLETVEDQLKVFDEIPLKDQYADLVRMAEDNLQYDKTSFAKMLDIYKKENITELLELMNDENNITVSEHQDIPLDERNKNWISKITEYAKEQPTFFGVGAGHLAGKNGVINLLRNAGYTVTAVLE